MKRHRVVLILLAGAALVFVTLVPAARRDRDSARAGHALAREERERLRVRLADLDRRTSEDARATATQGAAAARALRLAVLRATSGLEVSGVEISATVATGSAVAARGRLVAQGRFPEVLRLARRLAAPSSGLLLERVSLGETGGAVRIEADAFILKEQP